LSDRRRGVLLQRHLYLRHEASRPG
jgi:hypothetical protein